MQQNKNKTIYTTFNNNSLTWNSRVIKSVPPRIGKCVNDRSFLKIVYYENNVEQHIFFTCNLVNNMFIIKCIHK